MTDQPQSGQPQSGQPQSGGPEPGSPQAGVGSQLGPRRGPRARSPICAGIDIGTTAIKALAVDEDGRILAQARLPSALSFGPGERLEHDALSSWWAAPRQVLRVLAERLGRSGSAGNLGAVAVSAMMPSVAPVDEGGRPLGPGLLYGSAGPAGPGDPTSSEEMARLAELAASGRPGAGGYWPAQGVANASLGGEGVVDLASAFASGPLFGGSGWDGAACEAIGLRVAHLPRVALWGEPVGEVRGAPLASPEASPLASPGGGEPGGSAGAERGEGAVGVDGAVGVEGVVLGAGSVDGLCEQLVAGVEKPGDVFVVLGSTLVVWLCVPGWPEDLPAGLWRVPHLTGGMALVGGASNAGGLWADWADRVLRPGGGRAPAPGDVPVWWPWARGERVPWHDASLRVGLAGGHLSQGPEHLRRAALEASGFVARHIVELASSCGTSPRRYFVGGGGVANGAWVQALADTFGAEVVPTAVPEGAAFGAAFLARMAAGLETSLTDAARWGRWARPVEPRPEWVGPVAQRFERWASALPVPGYTGFSDGHG